MNDAEARAILRRVVPAFPGERGSRLVAAIDHALQAISDREALVVEHAREPVRQGWFPAVFDLAERHMRGEP